MHSILTKRIEMQWPRVLRGTAILLSLPSWVFIITYVVYRVRMNDNFEPYVILWECCLVCCLVCNLLSTLLFLLRFDDFHTTRSGILWVVWSAFPVALFTIFYCAALLFGLLLAHFGLL
jgi:hypothetical protein